MKNKLFKDLHLNLALYFKEQFDSDEKLDSSMLNVIRQFLKDNKIEHVPENKTELDTLANLPEFNDHEQIIQMNDKIRTKA